MIIDCISDLHGYMPELEGGDLLIVAGDITAHDTTHEWIKFYEWFRDLPYKKKVYIAGNHDGFLSYAVPSTDPQYEWTKHIPEMVGDERHGVYLCDSGIEFEGFKIWGSPWTPVFKKWHFMKKRGKDIKERWALIPSDTDILVTHGPPFGILDANPKHESVGCMDLRKKVDKIRPKLHVFGHIHERNGLRENNGTLFVNCSQVNDLYEPVYTPVRVIIQ